MGQAGALQTIGQWDHRASLMLSKLPSQSKLVKTLAIALNITGDEALWFPLPALLGFGFVTISKDPNGLFLGRRLLRIFEDVGIVGLLETATKLFFRRTRPAWSTRMPLSVVLGEIYSFPSGHAMRAAYIAAVLCNPSCGPTWVSTVGGYQALPLMWAIGVGTSRVILAKHFLSDSIGGFVMGMALGLSPYPSVPLSGSVRFLLALPFTLQAIGVLASDSLRQQLPGWPFLVTNVTMFWITFTYGA